MEKSDLLQKKIIFFDGMCVLCNSFVDRILKRDIKQIFYFSPLQGSTAQAILTTEQRKLDSNGDPTSVIYWDGGKVYFKTEAVAHILQDLIEKKNISKFILTFPKKLRNATYDSISKTRYLFFGKNKVCRVPTKEQEKRFLP